MICQRSKRGLCLLVVFLFLSSALFSEVCLTDEEAEELDQNLTQLETTLTEQATQIESQARQLTIAQASIKISEREILQLKDSFRAAEKYWRRHLIETAVLAGSGGLLFGALFAWILTVMTA